MDGNHIYANAGVDGNFIQINANRNTEWMVIDVKTVPQSDPQ